MGQFSFTDYVLASGAVDQPAIAKLADIEPYSIVPWSLDQLTAAIRSAGLSCRVTEDLTDSFVSTVLSTWQDYLKSAWLKGRPHDQVAIILEEAEAWATRLRALQTGALKLYRLTGMYIA
jgi:hypothetical protein